MTHILLLHFPWRRQRAWKRLPEAKLAWRGKPARSTQPLAATQRTPPYENQSRKKEERVKKKEEYEAEYSPTMPRRCSDDWRPLESRKHVTHGTEWGWEGRQKISKKTNKGQATTASFSRRLWSEHKKYKNKVKSRTRPKQTPQKKTGENEGGKGGGDGGYSQVAMAS